MGELLLVRHGETEWSRDHRHTGTTDLPLTPHGEDQARAVAPLLAQRSVVAAVTSPRGRARRTAALVGFPDAQVEDGLREWDYGGYEGRTTPEIQQDRPGWYLWRDGVVPGPELPGETVEEVGARIDRVLEGLRGRLADGDVLVVGHGHALRVLTARWLELPPARGRSFRLDTATLSTLGTEHGQPVITRWNTHG